MVSRHGELPYIPYQPDFEHRLHYRSLILPCGHPLSGRVSDFYQFDSGVLPDGISVIPDGCMDLLFCYSETAVVKTVAGYHRRMAVIPVPQAGCAFGVRFLPGGLGDFLTIPAFRLVGRQLPIEEVFGRDDLLSRMEEAATFEERVGLMTRFLAGRLPHAGGGASIARFCTEKILGNRGDLRISALSEETGYTTRYLRELYDRYVGISPKELCEIVQFQASLWGLACLQQERRRFSLCDLAAQVGYYDQSHMNKSYYKLVGCLPLKLGKELGGGI